MKYPEKAFESVSFSRCTVNVVAGSLKKFAGKTHDRKYKARSSLFLFESGTDAVLQTPAVQLSGREIPTDGYTDHAQTLSSFPFSPDSGHQTLRSVQTCTCSHAIAAPSSNKCTNWKRSET